MAPSIQRVIVPDNSLSSRHTVISYNSIIYYVFELKINIFDNSNVTCSIIRCFSKANAIILFFGSFHYFFFGCFLSTAMFLRSDIAANLYLTLTRSGLSLFKL